MRRSKISGIYIFIQNYLQIFKYPKAGDIFQNQHMSGNVLWHLYMQNMKPISRVMQEQGHFEDKNGGAIFLLIVTVPFHDITAPGCL